MARVDLLSTTDRARGARHAPTFSTVEAAHTCLIERLSRSKPHRVLYIADARDLEDRAEHLQQVLGAVLDYVGAIVADTDHVAPGGSIDRKYLLGLISDVAGDVAGSIANAADDLAEGPSCRAQPQRRAVVNRQPHRLEVATDDLNRQWRELAPGSRSVKTIVVSWVSGARKIGRLLRNHYPR
jgi:hypothetical protein